MQKKTFYILWAVIILNVVASCRKDDQVITDASAQLEFSTDSIQFDTVFTTVGSSTQSFIIYNRRSQPINISSITLGGGAASYYRLNVDGTPGKSFANVEVGPDDSLWVFIEVTVDPNNKNTPFIVSDSILFVTNGNRQWVNLVAFGQNAHFHKPQPNKGSLFYLDTANTTITWKHDASDSLPHVIYGYAIVQTGQTLNIEKGTRVYFHPRSGLIVMSAGTLKVNGEKDEPVHFLNDRLGIDYAEVPGQWDRIWLSSLTYNNLQGIPDIGPGTKDCRINYAVIKNAFVGLQVDTVFNNNVATAPEINNTIIVNAAAIGLLGQGSTIRCTNSIFANCGQYVAALAYGGDYSFRHCTFANYWNMGSKNRETPAVYINNYFESGNTTYVRALKNAYFGNCIVQGNMNGEVGLDSAKVGGDNFRFLFDHSLISINDSIPVSNTNHFKNILKNSDPQFADPSVNNYIQDVQSIVNNFGDPAITNAAPAILLDFKGNNRTQDAGPDLGPYEVK